MFVDLNYHHRLQQSHLLAVISPIPAIGLQGGIIHAKHVHAFVLRHMGRIDSILPDGREVVVPNGLLLVPGGRRSYPEEWSVVAGGLGHG